jgi:hypothetical protein
MNVLPIELAVSMVSLSMILLAVFLLDLKHITIGAISAVIIPHHMHCQLDFNIDDR